MKHQIATSLHNELLAVGFPPSPRPSPLKGEGEGEGEGEGVEEKQLPFENRFSPFIEQVLAPYRPHPSLAVNPDRWTHSTYERNDTCRSRT
jgi:hypothetical protein